MRINRSLIRPANRLCEVFATIRLPKNRRINIDRELGSLLDALAVEGSVDHIDVLFIRVVRGAREGAVEVSVTHPEPPLHAGRGAVRGRPRAK